MTPEEILEGNKLIAEFMGFRSEPFKNDGGSGFHITLNGQPKDWGGNFSVAYYGTLQYNIDLCLGMYGGPKYNSSWDWLMPVIEKIENCEHNVYIEKQGCIIYDKNKKGTITRTDNWPTKIEGTYRAVIGFINYFNQQKQ